MTITVWVLKQETVCFQQHESPAEASWHKDWQSHNGEVAPLSDCLCMVTLKYHSWNCKLKWQYTQWTQYASCTTEHKYIYSFLLIHVVLHTTLITFCCNAGSGFFFLLLNILIHFSILQCMPCSISECTLKLICSFISLPRTTCMLGLLVRQQSLISFIRTLWQWPICVSCFGDTEIRGNKCYHT